jgi:hypothetical protein
LIGEESNANKRICFICQKTCRHVSLRVSEMAIEIESDGKKFPLYLKIQIILTGITSMFILAAFSKMIKFLILHFFF